MDKYDVQNDKYCYPNTSILKNKLGIKSLDILEKAERDITSKTIDRISYHAPPYNLEYLKLIHKKLFSDLYDWAGELREVDISKGNTRFCRFLYIESESQKLFSNLKKENWLKSLDKNTFCNKLAEYYCEFNMIHPFREGNGRVQRIFFEHLALSSGYILDWNNISKDEWINANIDGVYVNYEPMKNIFLKILKN